jgi:predicted RNA-binding Zn ribbon-like protein
MSAAERPSPFFIADHLGLDFLNTLAIPVDTEVEWIASGKDLLVWLKQAGMVSETVLSDLQSRAVPGELDAVAAQARALRDWFRSFVRTQMGKPLPAKAFRQLGPLNQLLTRDEEFGQIAVRDGGGAQDESAFAFVWRSQRRWNSPESLLFPIARSLANLVCTENFAYIKSCEGPTCTLLFIDRTRARARRWCSMAVCGNRAKQAAHRNRTQKVRKHKVHR